LVALLGVVVSGVDCSRAAVDGGRGNVLCPALRPAMMPDFCLTSFGMLAVAVVDGLVGASMYEFDNLDSAVVCAAKNYAKRR
jgi:hypothetical protein